MEELFASLHDRLKTVQLFKTKLSDFAKRCTASKNINIKAMMQELATSIGQYKKEDKIFLIRENDLLEVIFGIASYDSEQRM